MLNEDDKVNVMNIQRAFKKHITNSPHATSNTLEALTNLDLYQSLIGMP